MKFSGEFDRSMMNRPRLVWGRHWDQRSLWQRDGAYLDLSHGNGNSDPVWRITLEGRILVALLWLVDYVWRSQG